MQRLGIDVAIIHDIVSGKWECARQVPRQEMGVRSLGREDPLEKEMATQSSVIPGKPHGQRSLVGYSSQGCEESDAT